MFDRPSWEHDPSLRDFALVKGLDDDHAQYDVKLDLGKKTNGVATFRATMENHSEREFSYRPKSVWAEIVPLLPSGEEKPGYTFYDPCFVGGCEVPKLEFRAAGWPDQATRAKVLLWFKFSPTSPDEELALNDGRWTDAGDWKAFELHGKGEPREKTIVLRSKLEETEGGPSCKVLVEQSVPLDMKLHGYKIELKPPRNSADSAADEVHCRSLPSPAPGQSGKADAHLRVSHQAVGPGEVPDLRHRAEEHSGRRLPSPRTTGPRGLNRPELPWHPTAFSRRMPA